MPLWFNSPQALNGTGICCRHYFAREYEAELHMLHATMLFTVEYLGYMHDVYTKLRELSMEHMAAAIEAHNAQDLKIEKCEKLATSPGSLILEYAEEKDIDLIVTATHRLTGLKHLLIGSVAEKVVRLAPCPVFTLKAFGKMLTTDEEKLRSSVVSL